MIPVVLFGVNVLCQIFVIRYLKQIGLLKSIYIGFATGAVLFLSIWTWRMMAMRPDRDTIAFFFVDGLIYSALSYSYLHFINLGETARRIRLLRELSMAPGGYTQQELLEHYNSKEIVGRRLGKLLGSGQVVCKEGRYYIGKPVMLFFSSIMSVMKFIVIGKWSEFD